MSEQEKTQEAEIVEYKVDGETLRGPRGKNLLEALLADGRELSYFCYHRKLSVAASCRQCLVGMGGRLVPSCQMSVEPNLEIETKADYVRQARAQMLEYTLVNHPVDCVICDKAGECTLQRHYMDWDGRESVVDHKKVDKPKKVDLGEHIMLDAERCILCSRCIRFCSEVAKSPDLVFAQRGTHAELTTAPGRRLDNAYSLNTVDICPVGALTDKDFRFRIRVWELFSTRSACTGCSEVCPTEIHHRDGEVYRMVPPKQLDMNLNWMCDYGRRTYKQLSENRITAARVGASETSIEDATRATASALRPLLQNDRSAIGVVIGADTTNEDLFVALRFARDFLETKAVYLAERPSDGNGDDILRTSDPNPNRAGAAALAGAQLQSAAQLEADLTGGKLKALYVVSDVLTLSEPALAAAKQLDAFVVQSSQSSPLTAAAGILLPAAMWAEVSGTVLNGKQQIRRLRPAIEPPGYARPHWSLLEHVGAALGLSTVYKSAHTVFEALKAEVAAFGTASWGPNTPTTMLRFSGSRG